MADVMWMRNFRIGEWLPEPDASVLDADPSDHRVRHGRGDGSPVGGA
jgi:hypothetical protein